ncbi:cupin domain-containing protein [uncultured Meiothermus sp.]|jgi:predicted cupin superfamily sugar epimerase|uniref:cupin domain-containing protein n=1 Tax=uncultured Meiothermus sp. TaxID=157471 RepID=UPI00260FD074|nr:cupin domain-containing protein [uncultured Meiothermus sp.]
MHGAKFWIDHLALQPHLEGGFFRQTYIARESIAHPHLPGRYTGQRAFSTAIYFLLEYPDFSAFHRLQSDEVWHFYAGSALTIWMLSPQGQPTHTQLGPDPTQGQGFQTVVPAGYWLGASLNAPESYALVGCTMAPGFDFSDFELAQREQLVRQFPQHRDLIERLTR